MDWLVDNNTETEKSLAFGGDSRLNLSVMDIRLFSVEEVCKLLNMGRVKVYELINRGKLKSVKIGASRRIRATALQAYVQQLEESNG